MVELGGVSLRGGCEREKEEGGKRGVEETGGGDDMAAQKLWPVGKVLHWLRDDGI